MCCHNVVASGQCIHLLTHSLPCAAVSTMVCTREAPLSSPPNSSCHLNGSTGILLVSEVLRQPFGALTQMVTSSMQLMHRSCYWMSGFPKVPFASYHLQVSIPSSHLQSVSLYHTWHIKTDIHMLCYGNVLPESLLPVIVNARVHA